ncbi:hypothetical protein FRX31_003695 [Thalictrum thalictroides]|uniref:Uncharacterized protein n=1 Tax=Thalictrum thalictroides TaxID=46969 RepID=A0A7J6XCR1_THATH|nr:hypothetical protein FRX31_003695 [Thalictrum thalictroides]
MIVPLELLVGWSIFQSHVNVRLDSIIGATFPDKWINCSNYDGKHFPSNPQFHIHTSWVHKCVWKMHMAERQWEEAATDFFEDFKSYDEAANQRRIRITGGQYL